MFLKQRFFPTVDGAPSVVIETNFERFSNAWFQGIEVMPSEYPLL